MFNGIICEPCLIGTYMDDEAHGHEDCFPCMEGTMAPSMGSEICDACPPSTFAPHPGSANCMSCREGSYTPTPGSQSCILCLPSTYSGRGATSCETCPSQHWCPGGTDKLPCEVGTFSSSGATNCTSCIGNATSDRALATLTDNDSNTFVKFVKVRMLRMKKDVGHFLWA